MSLLDRAFRSTNTRSVTPWDPSAFTVPAPGQSGGLSAAGNLVSEDAALGLFTVMRCVNLLSSSVSMLPLKTYQQSPDGIRQALSTAPGIIANPFHGMDLSDGIAQIVYSIALRGNAYCLVIARDALLRPLKLMVLSPDQVKVTRDKQTALPMYSVNRIPVDAEDIVHIKGLMAPGALTALNPIDQARTGLGLALATEEYGANFFRNGASMSGVIEVAEAMQPADATHMAQQFAAQHSGLSNAHLPAVLAEGAKWVSISITPDNAQFLQTRAFQSAQIASWFGVPPHLVGQIDKSTTWGSGLEIQGQQFVTYSLNTYLVRIANAFTALLPAGQWAEFDTDMLTRLTAPEGERIRTYAAGLMAGIWCQDEVRRMENLPPLPNGMGQVYRYPANLNDAEAAGVLAAADAAVIPTGGNTPVGDAPDAPTAGAAA